MTPLSSDLLTVEPLCKSQWVSLLYLPMKLSLLCPPDRTLLMSQKTCLLLAAAALLHLCRKSPPSDQVCHPLRAAHVPHLERSPSTRMEIYQVQWRRAVTNHIIDAGVGV